MATATTNPLLEPFLGAADEVAAARPEVVSGAVLVAAAILKL